jgi:hypothetical protein
VSSDSERKGKIIEMRAPSTKTLLAAFPNLDRKQACLIRRLAHNADNPVELESLIRRHCSATDAYVRFLPDVYNFGMWRRTIVLHAVKNLLGALGTGDSYSSAILIYSQARGADNLYIGAWATIVEGRRLPKRNK